jgi:hypothetical protein
METPLDGQGESKTFARCAAAAGLICAMTIVACANPGPPRPPTLQLPALVEDLSAERVGDRVLLRWTTPSQTTDKLDVKGSLTAEICRVSAPNAKKSPAACAMVKRVPTGPGPSSTWDDLPQPLLTDPAALLTYRVEIFNTTGRSAGKSTIAAYAAAGAAPPPVASPTASASETGAIVRWKTEANDGHFVVDLLRKDLSTPAGPAQKPSRSTRASHREKSSQLGKSETAESNEIHLRAAPVSAQTSQNGFSGTVDTTATMGSTYSYTAQQVRSVSIDGHALEIRSQPATPVTAVMRDTFPPAPPTGLATTPGLTDSASGASAATYIDLSWEPNPESDLAGYFVYRQLVRPNGNLQGPLAKLTPLPVAAPAYRDVAVAPGQRYSYSVTAVDASGNESAPSAKAQEVAAALNVGSPH